MTWGWRPTGAPGSYDATGVLAGLASIRKNKGGFVLVLDGVEHALGRKASFDDADRIIAASDALTRRSTISTYPRLTLRVADRTYYQVAVLASGGIVTDLSRLRRVVLDAMDAGDTLCLVTSIVPAGVSCVDVPAAELELLDIYPAGSRISIVEPDPGDECAHEMTSRVHDKRGIEYAACSLCEYVDQLPSSLNARADWRTAAGRSVAS